MNYKPSSTKEVTDVGCTVCFNSGRDTDVSLCHCAQTICRVVLVILSYGTEVKIRWLDCESGYSSRHSIVAENL